MPKQRITLSSERSCSGDLATAADILRRGGLVAFATETVYAVAAQAYDTSAIGRLRRIKNLPPDAVFPIHASQRQELQPFVGSGSSVLRRLVRAGMPGPLTIQWKGDSSAPPVLVAHPDRDWSGVFRGRDVMLRVPDDPVAAQILTAAGVSVVATSASIANHPPATDADDADSMIGEQIDLLLDSGPTRLRKPSTVVEVRGESWSIVVPGAVSERAVQRMAEAFILFVCSGNSCRSPMAEYLYRAKLRQRLGLAPHEIGCVVASAGTSAAAGDPASAGAMAELQKRGFDASSHRAQPVTPELLRRADRVYTMTGNHRRAVLEMAPHLQGRVENVDPSGPVSDPFGGAAEEYARCASQLEQALASRVEEFVDEDRRWQ